MRLGLIDPRTLAEIIDDPSLVVLDSSLPPPAEPYDIDTAFRSERVPRARRFDIEVFSDPESGLPHMVPSQSRFGRLAGELGIGPESNVVVYDQRAPFAAPRAWWLFRLFGHDNVRVLDGGLPAWKRSGGRIETGTIAPVSTKLFRPAFRPAMLAGLGDLAGLQTPAGAVILDARSRGRFEGSAPEPRPGIPSGHVPSSRSLPFDTLFDELGHLRSDSELRALLAPRGVDVRTQVIATCGTGITAAGLILALFVVGAIDTALYDGSWTEYATSGAPIEMGVSV